MDWIANVLFGRDNERTGPMGSPTVIVSSRDHTVPEPNPKPSNDTPAKVSGSNGSKAADQNPSACDRPGLGK